MGELNPKDNVIKGAELEYGLDKILEIPTISLRFFTFSVMAFNAHHLFAYKVMGY